MPGYRWQEFEALLARVRDVTRARAAGQVMAQLMDVQASSKAAKVHWLDWEHEKARRLLRIGGTAA
jgi:hypothetical protein